MDQVIQDKIFKVKSEIDEVQASRDKWMGDDFRFNGLRDRVLFGLMITATVITFLVSLFVADGIGSVFLNAGIAFVVSFAVVGFFLSLVDDSFTASGKARDDLFKSRKALIESTLDARVHEGVPSWGVHSSGVWSEFTVERDNVLEKVMVRIIECGEIETVETKAFVNV